MKSQSLSSEISQKYFVMTLNSNFTVTIISEHATEMGAYNWIEEESDNIKNANGYLPFLFVFGKNHLKHHKIKKLSGHFLFWDLNKDLSVQSGF